MGRLARLLVLGMVIVGFVAVVCAGFVYILTGGEIVDSIQTALIRLSLSSREEDLARSVSSDASPVRFVVNSGDSPQLIARNLIEADLIVDADLFVDYVRAEGLDIELEAGTYFLNQTQTIPTVARALTDSSSSHIPFIVLEGWRIEEVAEAVDGNPLFAFSGADFLVMTGRGAQVDSSFAASVGLPVGSSVEGFLYPNTYQLPPDIAPDQLRNLLTQAFQEAVGTQLVQDAAAQGYTLYQMVTLASIVEKEAVHPDEYPLIASVYRNRLTLGMSLDADPTVQYALNGQRGVWWPPLTADDYRNVLSDYNTYINYGLPPGPIANPRLSAIRAAVYPAESSYLYFRAACDGSGYHAFSTTYEEHIANSC